MNRHHMTAEGPVPYTAEEEDEADAKQQASAQQEAQSQFGLMVNSYDALVQSRLDDGARAFGYGDPNRPEVSPILHAVSYAEEPAVPKFQAEGRLLRAWRSRYWAACWPILQAVQLGRRPLPGEAELIAELDAAAPPPTEAQVAAEIASL